MRRGNLGRADCYLQLMLRVSSEGIVVFLVPSLSPIKIWDGSGSLSWRLSLLLPAAGVAYTEASLQCLMTLPYALESTSGDLGDYS